MYANSIIIVGMSCIIFCSFFVSRQKKASLLVSFVKTIPMKIILRDSWKDSPWLIIISKRITIKTALFDMGICIYNRYKIAQKWWIYSFSSLIFCHLMNKLEAQENEDFFFFCQVIYFLIYFHFIVFSFYVLFFNWMYLGIQ